MSTEQAWQILRTSAGCRLGDPGFYSPARLFRAIPARRRQSVRVQVAAQVLSARGLVESRS